MAVSVSRDLKVHVQEDVNKVKLSDRQQELRDAIQRGEPKCLGVSQVMLGLMVISYALPLHFTEHTDVVIFGVPWWTGLTFIAAGTIAIMLDKHCTMKILQVYLIVSVATVVLSVVAVIIYSVDLNKHPQTPCIKTINNFCNAEYDATKFSRGIKSSLLLITLVQAVISSIFCWLHRRQRSNFEQYTAMSEPASTFNELK
ncbi:transmembrane protein 176 [Girardinichthys multiradiatus]|uniref:transmembrane protein 176 n=1 Tax=Girardinichthys multiradiatus TaxID=208333 RepID=UPI001FAE528C|nr:transmembrane protein 176 [Girardinichthys multiradiatus]XP_047222539.1 transmembrane protein 176 [Girardinichthys multiradiatus]